MSAELIGSAVSPKTKKDLSRDAIALALKGEWEHAASLNRTIPESFDNDVEAMNRLGKALMELGDYAEARDVLDQVTRIAPYNSIARKNLARLEHLQSAPGAQQANAPSCCAGWWAGSKGRRGATTFHRGERQVWNHHAGQTRWSSCDRQGRAQ